MTKICKICSNKKPIEEFRRKELTCITCFNLKQNKKRYPGGIQRRKEKQEKNRSITDKISHISSFWFRKCPNRCVYRAKKRIIYPQNQLSISE